MSILIDVIIIALSCVTVYFSYKKGFAFMAVQVGGLLLAVFIASAVSKPIAAGIFDNFMADSINKEINKTITANIKLGDDDKVKTAVDSVYKSFPEFLTGYLENAGYQKETVIGMITDATKGSTSGISNAIVQTVIRPLATSLLELIIFLVILSVLMIIVKILSRFLSGVKKIPIIGPLNSFFGGVVGVLKASLIIYVLAIIAKLFIMCTGNDNDLINEQVINSTYIFKLFYKYNFLSAFKFGV